MQPKRQLTNTCILYTDPYLLFISAWSYYQSSKILTVLLLGNYNKLQEDPSQKIQLNDHSLSLTWDLKMLLYLSKFNKVFINSYQIFMKIDTIFLAKTNVVFKLSSIFFCVENFLNWNWLWLQTLLWANISTTSQ